MSLTADARSIPGTLRQDVLIDGRHRLTTDEPERLGGEGSAPAPHELFPAALAACVATTLAMYARTKESDLGEVTVAGLRPSRHAAAIRNRHPRHWRPEPGATRAAGESRRRVPLRRWIETGSSSSSTSSAGALCSRGLGVTKKRIVVLGGGTVERWSRTGSAATSTATKPKSTSSTETMARLPARSALRALDSRRPTRSFRSHHRQLRGDITFHENEVMEVWIERNKVLLDDGTVLPYDVLVVASGARLQPEETDGSTGPAGTSVSSRSTHPTGAVALHAALERFDAPPRRGPGRHADQCRSRRRVRVPR